MVCLLAGTRFTKSLVLFGGWQAACRLDCYKILHPPAPPHTEFRLGRWVGQLWVNTTYDCSLWNDIWEGMSEPIVVSNSNAYVDMREGTARAAYPFGAKQDPQQCASNHQCIYLCSYS
jgi:hypothetical protein